MINCKRYSPEVRERAVRMVFEHEREIPPGHRLEVAEVEVGIQLEILKSQG